MKKEKETTEQWDARRKQTLEAVQKMCLMDDVLMTVAFKNNIEAVQCMLQVIMADDSIVVERVIVQDACPNLYGRGVRLDVRAIDARGRHFDVEIQNGKSGANSRRCRHNGALMDVENVPSGGDPKNLPDSYVIFICKKDPYNAGIPVYTVEKRLKETGAAYDDGMHYLFVNGEYAGNDDYGKLAADLKAQSPETMNFQPLADAVKRAKRTEKGVSRMCEIYEQYGNERYKEGREEGHAEGREEGREEERKAAIRSLLSFMEPDAIAEKMGYPLDFVKEVAAKI